MFLNGLRAKSIYRKINKELANASNKQLPKKIKTVAVLQKEGKTITPAQRKKLAALLSVHDKDIIEMTLVSEIDKKDAFETTLFTENQIGWNGKLKSTALKDFTARACDVLISYYDQEELPLVAISVFSQARFKVGLIEDLTSINDLVVTVAMTGNNVFIDEMTRYMKILKIVN